MALHEHTSVTSATNPAADRRRESLLGRSGAAGSDRSATIDGGIKDLYTLADKILCGFKSLVDVDDEPRCHDLARICPTLAGNGRYVSLMSINAALMRKFMRAKTHFPNRPPQISRAINLKFRGSGLDILSQCPETKRGVSWCGPDSARVFARVVSDAKGEKTYYVAV